MNFRLTLRPPHVTIALGCIALYLTGQSVLGEYLTTNIIDGNSSPTLVLLLDLFSVNVEESIPTWFATLLLFGAAVLLTFIALIKWAEVDSYRLQWLGLAVIFLYLSADEGAVIHEILADPLREMFNTTGYLFFAWQIVAAPLVLLFALFYWRFWWHLPRPTQVGFVIAGILYVGGALAVEAISANQLYLDSEVITFRYLAIATVEECMEMMGVIVFIGVLLAYMVRMRYAAVIQSSEPNLAPTTLKPRPFPWRPIVAGFAGVVVVINTILLGWVFAHPGPAVDSSTSVNAPFYQTIIQQYPDAQVVVLSLDGVFDMGQEGAVQTAVSLTTLFDEVLVVTLPNNGLSIAFASDTLPFGQAEITQLLESDGFTDYLIFDTSAVEMMAEGTLGQ